MQPKVEERRARPRRRHSPGIEAEIRAERVAALFRQVPLAALVGVVTAGLMTALLTFREHDQRAVWWFGLVLLVAAARLASAMAWRRDPGARGRAGRWGAIGTAGAVAAGAALGGGAAWLWPEAEAWQLFWVFLGGGMCAGAAALHHAHLPAALGFILPTGLPFVARYALDGSLQGLIAAAMILVFLAAIAASAWRASCDFGTNARLRLNLAQQARELDGANQRLREEMLRHRATEASLRQAQKMEAVGQLTGGIAHDFNNLLTAVLGSLALLAKRLPAEDARAARLLGTALQGAQRGAALTKRLLAFGRRQTLEPRVVELPALVAGMAELLRGALGGAAHLRTEFPPGLPPVHVDANQLELALLNLVANARDAMPAGGEIVIGAAAREAAPGEAEGLAPGPYVVLSVTDAGEGMDEATLARAMEPFFTTKGTGKGTGLGLAMVHGLAAQSGGRLALRSTHGLGTVAELWLPRAAAAAEPPAAPGPAPTAAARQASILLVDDDPLVLASTAALIEDMGHVVVEAGSGAAALERLRGGLAPDLVLTDYAMPGLTGVQLAAEIRRLRPGLPVLLATGYAELEGEALAGLPRLAKPFEAPALAQAIAGCLEQVAAAWRRSEA
ncbi:ATP-binding protein [Paracraurococcus lichenis]|uniref:histidine kinase n=1 Tax=Paracraurococcus lichenis TaxID=3064888 RepID=A0ABT9DXR6_9PROT|nr:ATP-binding protein [Paracraurococcus sp. LOR1-02]MDO9708585.1 response regulator [Paracraurococcus sp. LOR1-02]